VYKHIPISENITNQIVEAVDVLVKNKVGAIIVIAGSHPLEHSSLGGIALSGEVSCALLLSIFDTRTPGHDGAVIIENNKVSFFGVHLPLARNYKNLDKIGTRHRAATGVTEETDALAIVVSEEKGAVSVALNGVLRNVDKEKCRDSVYLFMKKQNKVHTFDAKRLLQDLIVRNWIEKLSAIAMAIILWFVLIS